MEIEDSPIYKEIKEIIDDGPKPVYYQYKAKIHVDDKDFEVIKVISVDMINDYLTRVGDMITISVMLPAGLWAKVIYPKRDKLEMSLLRVPQDEVSDEREEEKEIEVQRFIAVPNPDTMPVTAGKDIDKLKLRELDKLEVLTIEFQLTDKLLHQLRLVTVGGIFRRSTPEDVIKYILAKETKKIKVEDEISFKGVDFVEPDNDEKREHFIVPQGTRIIDLPVYIQRRVGGLYNTGTGCYYCKRHWFIYPLYDTTRLEKAKKRLTIIKVPTFRTHGMERTYRTEGDTTYIIGTSNSAIGDDAQNNYTVDGNGTRFSDSRKYVRDFTEVKDNKSVAKRKEANHEFILLDRGKEKNSVYQSSRKTNSNPFVERSEIAGRGGSILRVMWENSDPSVLLPGMMCKIHYLDKDEVQELHGVLLGAEVAVQLHGQGLTPKRHTTVIALTIYVNPPRDEEQNDDSSDEDDKKEIKRWTEYEAI